MKNFKFSLDPFLRLKDVEKKRIELELSNCQLEIDHHFTQLKSEHTSISDMLKESEISIQKKGSIISLMSIPGVLENKKNNIKLLENSLKKLEEKRQEILMRLNVKNSEIKNVEERRQEKLKEYKKELDKIEEEKMSDLYKSVMHQKKTGVVV